MCVKVADERKFIVCIKCSRLATAKQKMQLERMDPCLCKVVAVVLEQILILTNVIFIEPMVCRRNVKR